MECQTKTKPDNKAWCQTSSTQYAQQKTVRLLPKGQWSFLACLRQGKKIENQKIHPRVATFQILHAVLLGISNHYDFCNQNALKKIPTTCVGIRRFLDFHMANLMGQVQQEFDSNKLKYRPVSIKKTTRSIWRAIKLLRNQTSKFGEICTEAMLVHHRLQKQSRKKMPN